MLILSSPNEISRGHNKINLARKCLPDRFCFFHCAEKLKLTLFHMAGPTIYLLQHHVDKLRETRSLFALDILPLCSQISGKYQIIASDQFKHIINHLSTQQAGLCVITSVLQPDQFHFFIARLADDDDGDCLESIRSLERSLLGFPMAAIFHRPSEFASGRQRTHQPPSPNASTQLAATMLGR